MPRIDIDRNFKSGGILYFQSYSYKNQKILLYGAFYESKSSRYTCFHISDGSEDSEPTLRLLFN